MPAPALAVAAARSAATRRIVRRVTASLAAIALPVGVTIVMLSAPSPAGLGDTAAGGSLSGCGAAGMFQVDDAGGALPVVPGFTAEQVGIAEVILQVARRLRVPDKGVVIAYATAIQESGMRNLSFGDRDSLGVFQQRPSADWGTIAQITNPEYAATAFFTGAGTNRGLLDIPGWESLPLAVAAQAVQSSGFPDAYARHEDDATRLLAALTGTVLPCSPVQVDPGIGEPPAPWTGGATGCSINDPTGRSGGCVTGAMLWVTQQIAAHRGPWQWGIGCWDRHAWNPTSDHPLGKACDYMVGRGGRLPDAEQKTVGDGLAAWLVAYAGDLSIRYVIWYGRIWQPGRGWKPYSGGGVYDPRDVTGGHFDHVHISVTT